MEAKSKRQDLALISPDEMNHNIKTVIIAPMTSSSKKYPTRTPLEFQGKKGQIVLDQIRTVDKDRLVKRIGRLKKNTYEKVVSILQEIFEL